LALTKQQPLPPAVDKDAANSPQQPPLTGQDIPLTFYKTLPHGAKAVIGSGLNLKDGMPSITKPAATFTPEPPAPQPVPKPAPVPAAAPAASQKQATDQAASPAKPSPKTEEKVQSPAKTAQSGAFTVQVASHKDKSEAESQKDKLLARGLAAYVVESKLPDKSTWYRVRIGKNLSHEEAKLLAGKAGKGALPLPE
jgi:cell division septation protein DedD